MRKFYMLFAVLLGVGVAGCSGETEPVGKHGTESLIDDSDPCACDGPEDLVCGSDGTTYYSPCDALCFGVEIVAEGECPLSGEGGRPGEPEECFELTYWDPVCVEGGETYPNREKATCEGVAVLYDGRCSDEWVCTAHWDPVCGTDGQTYGNECEATRQAHVAVAYEGECSPGDAERANRICTMDWSPVCGKDGRTYSNACFAGGPENVAHVGVCGCDCPDVYEPVCVGVIGPGTYPNACVAECSHFSEWDEGECEDER